MKPARRIAIAVGAPLLCVAGRQLTQWAFQAFGCVGDVKHIKPCVFAGIDLLPAFGVGLFWLPVIAILMLPFSVWFAGLAIQDWLWERRHRRAS